MTKRRRALKSVLSSAIMIVLICSMFNISIPAYASETEMIADEGCTGIYIGKAVSEDGTAIIARCADTHPTTVNEYIKIEEATTESGRVVTGSNGFSYTLPDSTYKYISLPRPAAMEKGNSWDSVASNEKGVAVTATITGYASPEALKADPYVEDGITEDSIAGIIAACAASSREAVNLIADIIDVQGSGESNIFMVADREECWYMEIYTGHQYAAVQLPEDCIAGFGNEFMLDTLDAFDSKIVSEGLETVPEENGFAVKASDGSLNLFSTYAGEGRLADYSNLRTWRIHQILAPATAGNYKTETKYPFLYKPKNKVSTAEIIDIFRDRMEGTDFEKEIDGGRVRIIGTETAAHAHVLKVHSDLPAEIAVEEWLCLSNAAYAPFVPISNAITSASDYYTYIMPEYRLDKNAAQCIYKQLNALAAQDREYYGLAIEEMWQEYETIWASQYNKVLEQAAELFSDGKREDSIQLLTNLSTAIQNLAITQAQRTTNDLMWYIMENTDTLKYDFSYSTLVLSDEPYEIFPFKPMVNAADFASAYGWGVSEKNGELKLTNGKDEIVIRPSDGKRTSKGSISDGNNDTEISAVKSDNGIFINLDDAKKFLKVNPIAQPQS